MTEGVFEKSNAGPNAIDITPNKDGGIMKEVKVQKKLKFTHNQYTGNPFSPGGW